MFGLLRNNPKKIPFLGDILFSILTFPVAFTFMEKWVRSPFDADTSLWLLAMYVTLGLVHLFRAFRLHGQSRTAFVVHLLCCTALVACGGLAISGLTKAALPVIGLTFWGSMLAERVLDIVRNRKTWRILLNTVAILLILVCSMTVGDIKYSLVTVGLTASLSALLSIISNIFSQIRFDILKEIIRKTYALEIIFGLLVMMVAFSFVLRFTDDAFTTFWDALWYCFAIVTTIGFGDLTPASGAGRIISVILGIYGIVVVALITSIIVNFYGEMKKTESD